MCQQMNGILIIHPRASFSLAGIGVPLSTSFDSLISEPKAEYKNGVADHTLVGVSAIMLVESPRALRAAAGI